MDGKKNACVALPESRQLDLLASMLEKRGVDVLRCPMVAIRDSPDQGTVLEWLERFCAGAIDLLVIYTGEGVQRLTAAAERAGLRDEFIARLGATPLLTRGPKPARALRALDIRPAHPAVAPTSAGVIATLADIDVAGKRVGVQLYGSEPLPALVEALEARGARVDCVAPYVYASKSDDGAVADLIERLGTGGIDAIAFTSKAQVERLATVAAGAGRDDELRAALGSVVVAAVGPVVARELEDLGVRVDVVPESDFFMKPMVTALLARLSTSIAGK